MVTVPDRGRRAAAAIEVLTRAAGQADRTAMTLALVRDLPAGLIVPVRHRPHYPKRPVRGKPRYARLGSSSNFGKRAAIFHPGKKPVPRSPPASLPEIPRPRMRIRPNRIHRPPTPRVENAGRFVTNLIGIGSKSRLDFTLGDVCLRRAGAREVLRELRDRQEAYNS